MVTGGGVALGKMNEEAFCCGLWFCRSQKAIAHYALFWLGNVVTPCLSYPQIRKKKLSRDYNNAILYKSSHD